MPITRKLLMPALLTLAIAPLSLTALADGQRGGHPGGHHDAGPHHEALLERLDLDAETRAAIDEARRAHQAALRELHAEHRAELEALLSDEQRQALAEARQEQREQRRAAMQARLDALIDGWELSEEQREALTATRATIAGDLAELREREFDDRETRRDALRELRASHHAALAEILDEAQLAELQEAMRPERGERHGKDRGHRHHDA
ncbi:hypothetical protein PRZ61_05345 [Halomonas pacifica]|uniref:hypothetical protein n=1 Tax=Bisbaumannia pacifica TaxID=77098 RepID=UPI00235892F7|nr:hypothetical protein [Halomonas pacifica]MDC8802871.1 hypothetical protein [Halomonas pacifica]